MHTIHTVQDGQLRIGLAEDCRRTLATLRRTQLFPVPRQYAQSPAGKPPTKAGLGMQDGPSLSGPVSGSGLAAGCQAAGRRSGSCGQK
jgi:hypothetical protein